MDASSSDSSNEVISLWHPYIKCWVITANCFAIEVDPVENISHPDRLTLWCVFGTPQTYHVFQCNQSYGMARHNALLQLWRFSSSIGSEDALLILPIRKLGTCLEAGIKGMMAVHFHNPKRSWHIRRSQDSGANVIKLIGVWYNNNKQ